MIRLTRRERLFAVMMIGVIIVWSLYALAVKPTRDRIRTLERVVPEKQDELREVQASSAEYVALHRGFEQTRAKIAAQDRDFQLPRYLETLFDKHKLSKNVTTMTPNTLHLQPDYSETIVEVELTDISLEQLTDLLKTLETAEVFVQIGRLHIWRNSGNEALLNATVEIHSPRLSQDAVAADFATHP